MMSVAQTDVRPPSRRGSTRQLPPGPLAGVYPAAAAMVVLFLVPYLGLLSALPSVAPFISAQLHMSPQTISLANGLANGAYAVGTVLAVQFAQLLPQRRMLLVYGSLLVIGSVLAAAAAGAGMFIAGHVLQGLCTSMLLIAAAPPLFLGFPAAKLRYTAVILNLCIFGAVAAGPLVGGAQASFHAWRPLFWIVTGIAVAALLLSLLTFQDAPPADRSAPWDLAAIALAASGSLAAFWGASELTSHRFADPVALVPLLGGLVLITVLWVYQYRARRPLLTLRSLTSTIPVTGVVVAICAAAASTSAIGLTAAVLPHRYTPLHLGLLYVPELGAAVIVAFVFGAVFSTRQIHYLVLTGMVFLAAGILVIRATIPPTAVQTLVGSGLIGVGIGASVTPALFLVGFSLASAAIQRVFAILELLRAVAAFLIVPVLLHFATTLTGLPTAAMSTALWICFALGAGGAIVGVCLYLLGGVRPSAPSLGEWMGGMAPAWESPPLLAAVRQVQVGQVLVARPARALAEHTGGARLAAALAGRPQRRLARAGGFGAIGVWGVPRAHSVPPGKHSDQSGPVVFAYDGSDMARAAIAEAGRQLPGSREALVFTVWRTFAVGFIPEPGAQFDAACAGQVREAAEQTAARGASLAEAAGFRAQGMAIQGTPTWKAIVDAADENQAGLIVIGSRGGAGLGGRLAASVPSAVAAKAHQPVLIVHDRHENGAPAPEPAPTATSSSAARADP
jgi:nucleotide-binding universal stress UspA family protein/MFS family permease